jgi:hypothetical protein
MELAMNPSADPSSLHRTAKYFMDTGRAASREAALDILQGFGLSIRIDPTVAATCNGQIALLTLINIARRTFLSGVEVACVPKIPCALSLTSATDLPAAVAELGGKCVDRLNTSWPTATIGNIDATATRPVFRLTWSGWRGGIVPHAAAAAPTQTDAMPLAPCAAAAVCAAEAFAYYAKDHPLAGRRTAGLSLWKPGTDWLTADTSEPKLAFLPAHLWLIGLGNLGQAYSWLLACLPYRTPSDLVLMLQDFDRIEPSNDSTSVLSTPDGEGINKTRHVAAWLEQRGFATRIIEQHFSTQTRRHDNDPRVALCGVDNALARASLEDAGFDLVVEAGLGAGPSGFRSLSMHTFPSSLAARRLWGGTAPASLPDVSSMPAYQSLKDSGIDACGLTRLASRTIGVPFVGLTAGLLVISELLRRLHSGPAHQVIAGSLLNPDDLEAITMSAGPYAFGHVCL